MKLFRIVTCICLAALCVSLLGGCRKENESIAGTQGKPPIIGTTNGPTGTTGQTSAATVQYLPAEVENPEGLPVLKWVCITDMYYGGKNRVWREDAVHELNQMLKDRNMPFRIQFVMLNNSEYTLYYDWAEDPLVQEALQDADLIYANMTPSQMKDYLSPISDYVTGDANPSLKNAVVHSLNWYQGTVDGEIYAIPTIPSQSLEIGWSIGQYNYSPNLLDGQTVLDQLGLKTDDFKVAFSEADDLLAKIYAAGENKPFLSAGHEGILKIQNTQYGIPDTCAPSIIGGLAVYSLHTVGSCFVIDHSGDSPKVVHMMELPQVRAYQEAYMRYRKAGYLASSDEDIPLVLFSGGSGLAPYTTTEDRIHIPIDTPVFKQSVPGGRITGIAASSTKKEQAASLLALIAEDEEFRMQLFYGKEGRDYTVSEDGYYNIVKREDGACYSLDIFSPYAYFCGLTSAKDNISYVSPSTNNWSLIETEEYSALEYYRQTLTESVPVLPITFDYSGLEEELTSIQQAVEKYYPMFTNETEVKDDPDTPEDEYIPIMDKDGYEYVLQEFKKAGADAVITELQRQLDTWLAENPDWNK